MVGDHALAFQRHGDPGRRLALFDDDVDGLVERARRLGGDHPPQRGPAGPGDDDDDHQQSEKTTRLADVRRRWTGFLRKRRLLRGRPPLCGVSLEDQRCIRPTETK
jgi:hypothetical protein